MRISSPIDLRLSLFILKIYLLRSALNKAQLSMTTAEIAILGNLSINYTIIRSKMIFSFFVRQFNQLNCARIQVLKKKKGRAVTDFHLKLAHSSWNFLFISSFFLCVCVRGGGGVYVLSIERRLSIKRNCFSFLLLLRLLIKKKEI